MIIRAQILEIFLSLQALQALHTPLSASHFLLQRLRTENLLLRQKMDMLEQESSDLADRLIQVLSSDLLPCFIVFLSTFHLISYFLFVITSLLPGPGDSGGGAGEPVPGQTGPGGLPG